MSGEIKGVVFDDTFEPPDWRRFRWDLIADQLRQRPGAWARVVDSAGRTLSQPALEARGSGCPIPLRSGCWQVSHRRGHLWLRYLGEDPGAAQAIRDRR